MSDFVRTGDTSMDYGLASLMRIEYASRCRDLAKQAAASMTTWPPRDDDPSLLVGEALRMRDAAEATLASAVAYARAAGATWEQIATQFGVKAPSAWKAWKPESDHAAARVVDPEVREALTAQLPDLDAFAQTYAGPAVGSAAPVSAGLPGRPLPDRLRELVGLLRQPTQATAAYAERLRRDVVERTHAQDGVAAARQLTHDLAQIAAAHAPAPAD